MYHLNGSAAAYVLPNMPFPALAHGPRGLRFVDGSRAHRQQGLHNDPSVASFIIAFRVPAGHRLLPFLYQVRHLL